jgi:glucose/arabinose dehydrogenase/mono/diheme cytochrome c family protein
MRFSLPLLILVLTTGLFAQSGDKSGETQQPLPEHIQVPPAPTLTAEEALKTFKIAPGFRIEIVAADPLVHNPVAMEFGPDGRIWVVEMSDFMPNPDGKGEDAKVGCIAVLEDTDGDGRMDKRTVFLDGLVMPRAFALVGDGVLVGEPTHLWFCRDTNGDGVADEKTEVASDYGVTTNPEHTANGLMWALDNWIYSANHTTRFHFDGNGKFTREPTATRGQWGITQDDSGRLFHNSNSDPLRADLVPTEYFSRNPYLSAPAGSNVSIVPANLPIWPGRVTTGVNRGYKTLNREGKITEVTAACAPLIYRGVLFPKEYYGNAFICEPSANMVKRILLTENGGTVGGHNAYEGTEFLTSTDERFRPVNLSSGPDGAIYLVDMYHGILQHRIYMTSYLRKQVESRNLAEGLGMGRIYRIVPEGTKPLKAHFDLAHENAAQLVRHLRAANSWWRDTAQRLLVERKDPAAIPLLRELARSPASPPLGRLHALWTLEGMQQLDRETVLAALESPDDRVTVAAIRLSEKWLAQKDDKGIFQKVTALNGAVSPRITLQKALSLGVAESPAAIAALASIAERDGRQPFVADGIISGLGGRELDFIKVAIAGPTAENAASTVSLATSAILKSRDPARITGVLTCLASDTPTPAWAQAALLDGVERFLPKTPEGKPVPGTLSVEPSALIKLAAQGETPASRRAAKLVDLLKWPGKPGLENESAAIAARLTPAQKILFEKGSRQFAAICAACHQPHGEGLSGLAPQLLYSRYVLGSELALVRIVLCGKEREGRVMPPLRALDDDSIAGVLTYIRQSWGHNAPPVSPALVTQVRKEIAGREEPWTDEELQKFSN